MDFLEALFPKIKQRKEHARRRRIAFAIFFVIFGLAVGLAGAAFAVYQARNRIPDGITQAWGVTFSKKYAMELGLDWKKAYLAALDDMGVRKVRIPAYWDEVEPQEGEYDFTALDWMLAEAQRRGATVQLAIGRRLPRWPECHDPVWLNNADQHRQAPISKDATDEALLRYIRMVVERYRGHPAVVRWQVENEPFLTIFGICPPPDARLLGEEINLVRSLDVRPIIVTDAGELSSWIELSYYGDILGVSLYRIVWNQWFGYFYWPLPSWYYRKKAELNLYRAKDVIITEVQLEPWTDEPITQIPLTAQLVHFDAEHFRDTIAYARATGLPEIYLWGVEWWYWARTQGHPEFWDMAKEVFNENIKVQSSRLPKPVSNQ